MKALNMGLKHSAALAVVLAALMPAAGALAADEAGQESVSLTVYNQNFALVKDVRVLDLVKGNQEKRIDDVAASIDATSVHFAALDHPGDVAVLEQNFQYDLASADRLLDRYLNLKVSAVMKDGTTRDGTLLSYDGGSLVLGAADGGAVLVNRAEVRDVRLGEIPGGLVVKPTLVWTLASDRAGKERAEISYLTDNVNWHAEYVAVVNSKDTGLKLDGWVSLDNKSGATYRNAKLKLVAGEVHRVQPLQPAYPMARPDMVQMKAAGAPQFEEHPFFEYHIYTLERPATVADRETKQLSLFPSTTASARKVYTYDGQKNPKDVMVEMEFVNAKDNGLGMALPAGKVRVFKEDTDGSQEFVGEDSIDHTPRDEKVRVYLGNAFDVVGERTQTNFQRISDRTTEQSVKVEIRNHKDEAITVTVVEHLYGDWTITQKSQEFEKKDARTVEFTVPVAANGNATVTYTVRTTT